MEKENLEQEQPQQSLIDHDASLEEVFKAHVESGLENLKKDGYLFPATFLVFRDYKENKYKIAIYPLIAANPAMMKLHAMILKELVAKMKKDETTHFKLVGVFRGMEMSMSEHPLEGAFNPDGSLKNDDWVKPSDDPKAKDVALFELEDKFSKHSLAYEYIRFEDGQIVIKKEPILDHKAPYDSRADKNSSFGYLFAEGTSQN